MKIEKLKCKRCKHEWVPRTDNVVMCPACKSRLWNKGEHAEKENGLDKDK